MSIAGRVNGQKPIAEITAQTRMPKSKKRYKRGGEEPSPFALWANRHKKGTGWAPFRGKR